MLVLKWNKVFDGVQLIKNRLQQDVQLHSEFKGKLFIAFVIDPWNSLNLCFSTFPIKTKIYFQPLYKFNFKVISEVKH